MRLHRLSFCAIGPFGGTHTIDFDTLTADGIFLLEGPTGAGKSTIIDAIVFALYGSVASKDSTDRRMRSTHSPAASPSWVDLIFSVSSGMYRIRRTPAWDKPKRGGGFTHKNSTATLWKFSQAELDEQQWDGGEAIATQVAEASTEVQRIIGLNKAQFVQTVVLPQGEFAEFLRLNSSSRSELLQKIFRTKNYAEFTQFLKDRARDATARVATARQAYSSAIESWLTNEGIADSTREDIAAACSEAFAFDMPRSTSEDSALLDLLRTAGDMLAAQSEQCAHAASLSAATEKAARDAYLSAQQHAQLITQREDLLSKLAELEARQEQIEALMKKLDEHRAAIVPALRVQDTEKAQRKHAASIANLHKAREALLADESLDAESAAQLQTMESDIHELSYSDSAVPDETNLTEVTHQATQEFITDLVTRGTALVNEASSLVTLEKDTAKRKRAIKKIRREADSVHARINETSTALSQLPLKREAMVAELTLTHKQANDAPALKEKRISLTKQLETAQRLNEQTIKETKLQEVEHTALREYDAAKADYLKVSAAWTSSTSAELALALKDHTPCPVCGSTDHPIPAKPAHTTASKEDVDTARDKMSIAESAYADSQRAVAVAQAEIAQLNELLGGANVESAQQALTELDAQLDEALAAHTKSQALETKIDELEKEKETLNTAMKELETQHAALTAEAQTQQKLVANAEAHIAQQCKNSTPTQLLDQANKQSTKAQALEHAYSRYLSSYDELCATHSDLRAALESSPFTDVTSAVKARVTDSEAQEWTSHIEEYHSMLSGVNARLAAPEMAQLSKDIESNPDDTSLATTGDQAREDLAQAQKALTQAVQENEEAHRAATLARKNSTDAARLYIPVKAASQDWHAAAIDAGPITTLASIAHAGHASASGIPLNIWVLLQRFEIVVERANDHLGRISGGRYELKRTDTAKGNNKAGLDLVVIDHEGSPDGNDERETSSLSGGETFFTSLSLALALAQVVQEERGGVAIDTLLIDEGFGTLSEDVREAVMMTLNQLTTEGRVVGIVSHIEELKQMVPARVSIRRLSNGSSTLDVVA